MAARNFTMDMRDDGSARLSLSYKGTRQHGISRISCEIPAADLVQLVLFEGSVSLQNTLGTHRPIELALDGLVLEYGVGDTDVITFDRQLGFSSQTVSCPLKEFHAEMADVTDICLEQAERSKHGPLLKDILSQCAVPDILSERMDADAAEEVFHRLREMILLILVEETSSKGSALARKLRAKKTREDAAEDIRAVLISLAGEFAPDENQQLEGGAGRS